MRRSWLTVHVPSLRSMITPTARAPRTAPGLLSFRRTRLHAEFVEDDARAVFGQRLDQPEGGFADELDQALADRLVVERVGDGVAGAGMRLSNSISMSSCTGWRMLRSQS